MLIEGVVMGDLAREELSELILRYLRECPRAGDSLRGICEWWIPMQRVREAEADVRHAVDQLVASGRVIAVQMTGGEFVYQARQSRDGPPHRPASAKEKI
jgi:hypothetical protein